MIVHFTKDGAALIECRRENGTIKELRVIGADEKPSGHDGDRGDSVNEEGTANE